MRAVVEIAKNKGTKIIKILSFRKGNSKYN